MKLIIAFRFENDRTVLSKTDYYSTLEELQSFYEDNKRFLKIIDTGNNKISFETIVSEITENRWLHQIYLNTRDQVANGYAMSAALKRQELFPLMFIELLAVGEATGEMELMLQKIADFCQLDIDRMSERLQALMEPVMILVLGVFIGILVLAIAMPILNTITAFS